MKLAIFGILFAAFCPVPVVAHERLVESIPAGSDRICIYRDLLPGVRSEPERTLRVGLGMPCPSVSGVAENLAEIRPKPPMLAQLEEQVEEAGRTVCSYRFGNQRYNVPISPGRSCPLTPSGL